jgi:hypothetical protein
MTRTETRAIARVLSIEDHAFIGIRPADATPAATAAFALADHMRNEFQAGPPAPPGAPPTLRTVTASDVLITFKT